MELCLFSNNRLCRDRKHHPPSSCESTLVDIASHLNPLKKKRKKKTQEKERKVGNSSSERLIKTGTSLGILELWERVIKSEVKRWSLWGFTERGNIGVSCLEGNRTLQHFMKRALVNHCQVQLPSSFTTYCPPIWAKPVLQLYFSSTFTQW